MHDAIQLSINARSTTETLEFEAQVYCGSIGNKVNLAFAHSIFGKILALVERPDLVVMYTCFETRDPAELLYVRMEFPTIEAEVKYVKMRVSRKSLHLIHP